MFRYPHDLLRYSVSAMRRVATTTCVVELRLCRVETTRLAARLTMRIEGETVRPVRLAVRHVERVYRFM